MHIAGKIFLGLGLLITLAGVVLTIGGGSALSDAGDWDVEEKVTLVELQELPPIHSGKK